MSTGCTVNVYRKIGERLQEGRVNGYGTKVNVYRTVSRPSSFIGEYKLTHAFTYANLFGMTAEVIDLSDRSVVKNSAAIQIEGAVSFLGRKCWNVALANAYDELPDCEEHEIRIADLSRVIGYKSNDRERLKKALRELVDATVEWNVLEKDKESWGASSLLAHVQIDGGVVRYSYSPFLRRMLHSPKMYARISLSLQNQFSSKYSLALYELVFDYFDTSRQMGETPWIPLAKVRKLMGVEDDQYPEFKIFNRAILKRAIDEVIGETDMEVEMLVKKVGRTVSEIKFCSKSKRGKRVKESARLRVQKGGPKKARIRIDVPRDKGRGIGW